MAVFGDSITWQAQDEGRAAAAASATAAATPLAIVVERFTRTCRRRHFQSYFTYLAVNPADVVLIATGTNDANDGGVTKFDGRAIDNAVNYLNKAPCVLLVQRPQRDRFRTTPGGTRCSPSHLSVRDNFRVLDFGHLLQRDRSAIGPAPDNVHLTAEGQQVYAEWLMARIAEGC